MAKRKLSAEEMEQQSVKKHRTVRTIMIVLVVVLASSAIVGLSVALVFMQDKVETSESYRTQMESVYSRSYYDLVDGANDLDVSLSKLSVASSPSEQETLLMEMWNTANVTESAFADFNDYTGSGVEKATKFVNQLGDYSKACAIKLSEGGELDSRDMEVFSKMKNMAGLLKNALKRAQTDMNGALFLDGGTLDIFSSAFETFVSPDIEYPQMIYDGPFSDALEGRDVKYLSGLQQLDSNACGDILGGIDGFSNVKYTAEGGGDIPTWNYTASYGGKDTYVAMSKSGGKLILLNGETLNGETVVAKDLCELAAVNFAQSLGYADMQSVWSYTVDGICYVNLAPIENGVILYPDLIKVKLSAINGKVTGFDASNYCFNHTSRDLPSPVFSATEAEATLTIDTTGEAKLCLIPMQETREILCYEFIAVQDGTYYIYVNALTGREQNILYVIDSATEGTKLI